jgi:N-acetyltransferase
MQIFETTKQYILENDIVLLRPLEASDYDNLLPFAINEPEIWTYSLVSVSGVEGLKNYITTAIDARAKGTEYPFIVFDKRTQQYAGSTRFYDIQLHNQSMQLGYTWYGGKFQGTGLNKNCKLLLLQFAFDELGLERVEFRADNNNERSKAAMRSIGCVEEGVLRSHLATYTGIRRSSIILSILKDEWYAGVKENLKSKTTS